MAPRGFQEKGPILQTFGRELLKDPVNVTTVSTVVPPRAILAGTES